jgi:hypothetical protein
VPSPFINYHAGINPKYRGQDPAYWARVQGDAEHAGITIHLVDEGVDTGAVLFQTCIDLSGLTLPHTRTAKWRRHFLCSKERPRTRSMAGFPRCPSTYPSASGSRWRFELIAGTG